MLLRGRDPRRTDKARGIAESFDHNRSQVFGLAGNAGAGAHGVAVLMRQMRRRNGAYFWQLFHDSENPTRFIECFIDESWVEHLRQHQRGTVASDTAFDGVRSFLVRQPVEHLLSAYSPGALDPIVPYQDTDHADVE